MSLNAPHSVPPTPYQSIEKPPAPLFPLFRFIFFSGLRGIVIGSAIPSRPAYSA